jgi:hypothetical protein
MTYRVYVGNSAIAAADAALLTAVSAAGASEHQVTGLKPSTTYHVLVIAVDEAGNAEVAVAANRATASTRDTIAPSGTRVTLTELDGGTIHVEWADATDDLTAAAALRFDVYVADVRIETANIAGATKVAPALAGVAAFDVKDRKPGAPIHVAVLAIDEAGNVEVLAAQNRAALNLYDVNAPSGTTVTVDDVSTDAVVLSWTGATDDRSPADKISYEIYYAFDKLASADYRVPQVSPGAGVTEARIAGLEAGRTYVFAVLAIDESGNRERHRAGHRVLGEDREARGAVVLLEPRDVLDVRPMDGGDRHWLHEREGDLDAGVGRLFPADLVLIRCPGRQVGTDESADALRVAILVENIDQTGLEYLGNRGRSGRAGALSGRVVAIEDVEEESDQDDPEEQTTDGECGAHSSSRLDGRAGCGWKRALA